MAKPRSNYDGALYWAESILEDAPRASCDVNSIIVRNDVVYSFGSHYPMGKIFRREDGSVRRVVVTSSYYPVRGWANTPQDQDNVRACAAEMCAKANIELESKPLSAHGIERLPCLPRAGDPAPPQWCHTDIVPYFPAFNPGPEPVRGTEGCIAGTYEAYSYQIKGYVWTESDARPGDHPSPTNTVTGRGRLVHRWENGYIYWGAHREGYWYPEREDGWNEFRAEHSNVEYKTCPHCAIHNRKHARWSEMYNGAGWGRWHGRGWKLHAEMMDTYGSERGWRDARLADFRRVKATRKARAEWEDRNFIPYQCVDTDADGILRLDSNGYVLRKNSERIFAARRREERNQARLRRFREEQERLRRQAQRALARRERNILKRSPYQRFIATARTTADELHSITTNELES